MSESPVISLDVRLGDVPGWQNVKASNNQTYSYRYTGGDGGKGNIVAIIGEGRVKGVVQLVAEKRYEISGCKFQNDPEKQLKWRGDSPRAGAITDENTAELEAKYTIIVADTENEDCTIPCDPMIHNRPPSHL